MPGNSRKVGVWIDHRQAVIVVLEGDDVAVHTIESNLDGRTRTAGGSRSATPYGPQDIVKEGAGERRFAQQLRAYYADVLARVGAAGVIYAFGPARARYELIEAAESSPLHRGTSTETAPSDKLTNPQIVAHVKKYFGRP